MATMISVTPNAFSTTFKTMKEGVKASASGNVGYWADYSHVRRPVRGLQIKDDTYATLEVKLADGSNLNLVDAGGLLTGAQGESIARTSRFSNFLIQGISEAREEKSQIVVTFGAPYIYFYGEQPRFIQVQGVLLNSEDFNWRAEWWQNYDQYLRGTRCVERKARVYLTWDDILVEGYMMNSNCQESSENPLHVSLTFNLFLTNYTSLANISPLFPKYNDAVKLDPSKLDTTGEGIGNLASSTLQVRAANMENATSTSLMQTIREGMSKVVELGDIIYAAFDKMSSFLAGRNIRVPIGFEGTSVFDDLQMSQAGIYDPSIYSQLGPNKEILLAAKMGNGAFYIQANLWSRFVSSTYGDIRLNTDEYIATAKKYAMDNKPPPLDPFSAEQYADSMNMADDVRKIFALHGINTEPPNELLLLAARVAFGIVVATTKLPPGAARATVLVGL